MEGIGLVIQKLDRTKDVVVRQQAPVGIYDACDHDRGPWCDTPVNGLAPRPVASGARSHESAVTYRVLREAGCLPCRHRAVDIGRGPNGPGRDRAGARVSETVGLLQGRPL